MTLADGLILLLWKRAYGYRPVDVVQVMNLMDGISLTVAGEFLQRVAVLVKEKYITQDGNTYTLEWSKAA